MVWRWSVRGADRIGVGPLLRPLVRAMREQREYLATIPRLLTRRKEIQLYLDQTLCRKLQLGGSDKLLPGWLNTDIAPASRAVTYLDAARPFPLPTGAFDFIFCEHFIEHIERKDAANCLSETFRCLRPGGVLRVATPDLERYAELFSKVLVEDQRRFLELGSAFYRWERPSPCLALNHLVYNWGHRFLYTPEELSHALRVAGFADLEFVSVGQSAHAALRGIERHADFNGHEINAFETMVIEATKASH